MRTPTDRSEGVSSKEEAAEALQKLTSRDVRQVPVVKDGRLGGMLHRGDILRWLTQQSIL